MVKRGGAEIYQWKKGVRGWREGRNIEGQDRPTSSGKGTKVQISAKSHEAKYRRRSLEVVSLGRAQNNHDARLTISLG